METVWRVAAIYLFLMLALRTMGKRDMGQLAPFDLVILLLIPELFSQAMVREDFSLTNAFVGVSTLLSLVFLTSVISYLDKRVERVVEGQPTVLVQHGLLVPAAMNRERVAPEEILAHMHNAGLERMEQVKWGILETDGKISFVPWEQGGSSQPTEENRL
jgi:uncharacterized membrane protein YcaP (DUF421 family)